MATVNSVKRALRPIRKTALRIRNWHKKGVVILTYHRVDFLPDYPYPIIVKPDNFANQMDVLQRYYHPLSLVELADAIERRKIPNKGVVVTFDDGYIDNLTQALPILEAYRVPATVFVTTANLNGKKEFWWDELERVFLIQSDLPETLRISICGELFDWRINSFEQRRAIRKEVHALIRPLSVDERNYVIKELIDWANLPEDGRLNYRTMTSDELHKIKQGGLVELGAHTVNHPMLSSLTYADQYLEIVKSKHWLEAITGFPIETFSYPFGSQNDYDERTVEIARSAGFRVACTMNPGIVTNDVDPFQLPRWWVGDWEIETFIQKIDEYFKG
jgi:peptidoglycan/xylan/chitin deacetylase (PgdA/CDA1 family)